MAVTADLLRNKKRDNTVFFKISRLFHYFLLRRVKICSATIYIEAGSAIVPDDAAGVAAGYFAGGDVLCHHAAGSFDCIAADRHARQDDGAAADPDVVADGDWTVRVLQNSNEPPELESPRRSLAPVGWNAV